MFLSRKGGREHLNNTTRDFYGGGGKKVISFFVEIFFNKTAKSSHKREDIIRRLNISIEKLTNDTIFERFSYNVDF